MIRATHVPLVIKPPVYELTINLWNWCKLAEVRALVPDLARAADVDFNPTSEELVSNFAALTRFNRIPEHLSGGEKEKRKVKIFRFSTDGRGVERTNVPFNGPHVPPYVPFQLSIGSPYPDTLFVTEEWATDVLRAVRRGAVKAAWWDSIQVGFPPRPSNREVILLSKHGIESARKGV